MTSPLPGGSQEPAPVQRWEKEGLARLQAALVRDMLRFTAASLGDGSVVRGVLPGPDGRGVGRVVVWDGHDLGTSVAYDLPLLDRHGDNIPVCDLAAALRQAVRGWQAPGAQRTASGAGHDRDGHGIPVVAAENIGLLLEDGPEFDLTDALHGAAAGIAPSGGCESAGELCLLGFLLLDRYSARLYMTGEGLVDVVGLDVSLRDEAGTVAVGVTGLAAALPSLVADDQLRYNPSDAVDPYCSKVFDLAHW
ncbi:hypothetical protein [Streptomyces sp. SID12501]|uniref:Uncharacterized protein n=1 Tax=Streptomyces sp. SID12501 TaxID=2706042 RepID=A0A6B3BPV5_9ACTN|nr:hypothetical protein [Streptomyces sp. SID12501]NEC86371.1 hypothetical protein [Streptomyces sp. SID12501]